ncbi:hypothetical protein PMI07_002338 [Rhizobium sp. CF080]|nr:hypothetical protein PMI07_002338 [Rhizobium sp. CF080]
MAAVVETVVAITSVLTSSWYFLFLSKDLFAVERM